MANLAFKNTETTMKEKLMIYQVLPRLYGNKKKANVPAGTLKENGCGKMNDFTSKELNRIRDFGFHLKASFLNCECKGTTIF